MARKNGKTALIAGLVLAHLVGPEAISNGEVYSAANDREQAAIVFKMARQIVEADPELLAAVKVVPSTKTLVGIGTASVYRALSAEAGTKHGFNPTMVIFDELAQAKNRDLYDVLDTSMGARAEPLFITISTQSNDPEHILSKLIDDGLNANDPRIVCHLYAVPEDADIFNPKVWKLGNPALGDFLNFDDLQAEADKARRLPAEEPRFRNLRLNQRVAPTTSLISRAEWVACQGDAEIQPGDEVYLALDLSSTTDLTALVVVGAGAQTPVNAYFWKPEDHFLDHSERDFGSGHRRYIEWREQGWIEATPGRSIDPLAVARKIAELCGELNVLGLAYDRWRINDLLRHFDAVGLQAHAEDEEGDGLRLVKWGQGFRDMAPAIDALELEVIERRLVHPGSPILTWNIANAVSVMDPSGNRKIDKSKARFRIDGAVALAMACGLKARDRKDDSGPSFWEVLAPV